MGDCDESTGKKSEAMRSPELFEKERDRVRYGRL